MKRISKKPPQKSLPAGGVATSVGMDYEFRVAAWFMVQILAEKDITVPWRFPAKVTLESIRLETEYPVDDILVGASNSGRIFVQVKHNLSLEKRPDSDLASAIDQVVRQYVTLKSNTSNLDSEHRFYPDRDRLLIITSPISSTSITSTAPSLLEHIRDQTHHLNIPAREQQCLSVLRAHISRSWRILLGSDPSDDEILRLLSLVYIFVLDTDREGKDELSGKSLLRQSILKKAEEVDVAWALLVSKCTELSRSRGGLDRNGIQTTLEDAGIHLRVTNSYREDVERLKEYTRLTFNSVSSLSKIMVGSEEIKVERVYTSKIQSAAESSHLLVVGEPGSGKSGTLHDFVELLFKQEADVVLIAVDRLSSYDLADEIRLSNQFYEVLLNWPGIRPGFLVIDALDGARNEQMAQQIRNLIEIVIKNIPRWHIVASIRKFDLRYNVDLKSLFHGNPVNGFSDEEFAAIQHINIRDFNESELDQIRSKSSELSRLLGYKDHSLAGLLRKPFNLRLIGELIGEGITVDALTPVRTQVELLSKYWSVRVIKSDSNGSARELVLTRIVEEMLKDLTMRTDRSSIVREVSTGQFIEELLSSHVLIEWQPSPHSKVDRYVLAFSHNMLFDYAVSRLVFSGSSARLVRKLEENHELVLAIRPSIVYHFHDLWGQDPQHERFWGVTFELMASDHVPLIGKLIGPSVAVELARHSNDYDFVYSRLEGDSPKENQLAQKVIQDTTGALLVFLPEGAVLDDKLLLLWAEFTEQISRSTSSSVVYSVRAILLKLCEKPNSLTQEHKEHLGKAARRLLEFAWSKEGVDRDRGLVIHALQAVCRTYESDPIASNKLIHHSLEKEHLDKYGFEEMPRLADEIELLIINAPDLAEEIYRKAFAHKETSEEKTSMGGRILGLTSTKRQDFHMAQWRLAESFQSFLDKSPIRATRALVDVIQAYVDERHPVENNQIAKFILDEVEATIVTDYSAVWDADGAHGGDEAEKMLNIFTAYLQNIASSSENTELLRQITHVIALQNRSAVFWKKMLVVAASNPATYGVIVRSLSWTKQMLIGYDTTTAAGNFIGAIYDYLDRDEKIQVEKTILSIAEDVPEDKNQEFAERHRDRLLGCIRDKDLALDESRRIIEYLTKNKAVPENSPLFSMGETSWSQYTDEDVLREQGVSLEIPEHKQILRLQNTLRDYRDVYRNTSPSLSKANEILSTVLTLEDVLNISSGKIDQHVKDYAWGYIAEACETIASAEQLDCQTELSKNIKRLLLLLANYASPEPNSEQDEQFGKFQSWGSPSARINAASGLILLARFPDCLDNQLRSSLARLAKDDVAAVRFQIAVQLNVLSRTAPDLMWSLLNFYATDEINNGVIKGLFQPLHRLAGPYPNETVQLAKLIFDKTADVIDVESIAQLCVSIFLGLHLWQDQQDAGQQIRYLLDRKGSASALLIHLATQIRGVISEYNKEPVRLRAIEILNKLTLKCVNEFQQIQACLSLPEATDSLIQQLNEIMHLADSIAMTIYFSSGAFTERTPGKGKEKVLSLEEKRMFLDEVGPAIKLLSQVNHASIIHHLVETLETLVPANPAEVFLLVHQLVKAGKPGGYQYESLAVDHIVQIVERYLAEYRLVLRENSKCQQALLEILDIFVEVGWPNARKLTYRLEEIFR